MRGGAWGGLSHRREMIRGRLFCRGDQNKAGSREVQAVSCGFASTEGART